MKVPKHLLARGVFVCFVGIFVCFGLTLFHTAPGWIEKAASLFFLAFLCIGGLLVLLAWEDIFN